MSALSTLSDELAGAVATAGRAVVSVLGGGRRPHSGVIWKDRTVVTADHALDRDDDLGVRLHDGTQVRAVLAGRDPSTDLAVLKIEGAAAEVPEMAPADALRIGHVVLAVGSTGEGPAASMGVVSALGGPWNTWRGGRVDRFIRADLSLYPGFSGGALVDGGGKIIGVNTSGLSRHWPVTLPASTVDRVVATLLSKGRVARGYLGVGLQSVRIPDPVRRSLALQSDGGAIVVAVEPGSPAEAAGLMIGDVVLALDGAPVADVEDLFGLLGPERVGLSVAVDLIRAGARAAVRVTVGERAETED